MELMPNFQTKVVFRGSYSAGDPFSLVINRNMVDDNTNSAKQPEKPEKNVVSEDITDSCDTKTKDPYKDPLSTWPIKGLAYTNEIGAAISGVAPRLGTALWAPALMYIGADIYDKWKNEDTSYNPSGKRGVKQAVFQGCASVVLPTAAVCTGQKIASFLVRGSKTGLSSQAREDALVHSMEYMKNHSLSDFEGNIEAYKNGMRDSVKNAADTLKSSYKAKSLPKKILTFINPFKDPDNLGFAKPEKLDVFISKQAEKTMKMRQALLNGQRPEGMSKKLFKQFQRTIPEYKEKFPDKYMQKAVKSILEEQHKSQILKNRLIKTVGGFIALALLIKPIDKFVEKVIIKKTVEPSINYIEGKVTNLSYKGKKKKEVE